MTKYIQTQEGQQRFEDLVRMATEHDNTLSEEERLVKEQKSLLYKFYCKVWYGHLFKDGVCLRCKEVQRWHK